MPFLFVPVFLSLFGATHNLALSEPSMTSGGALWFVDLVLPDPTWMLPVAASLSWLTLMEMTGGSFYMSNPNLRMLSRTLAVAFIPVVANMPAGVFCFWLASNCFSMLRVQTLNTDIVRSDPCTWPRRGGPGWFLSAVPSSHFCFSSHVRLFVCGCLACSDAF